MKTKIPFQEYLKTLAEKMKQEGQKEVKSRSIKNEKDVRNEVEKTRVEQ